MNLFIYCVIILMDNKNLNENKDGYLIGIIFDEN